MKDKLLGTPGSINTFATHTLCCISVVFAQTLTPVLSHETLLEVDEQDDASTSVKHDGMGRASRGIIGLTAGQPVGIASCVN